MERNMYSKDVIDSLSTYSLLAVQLQSGDVLLGGVFHIPHIFEGFPLAFNTSAGDIFNNSAIAQISYESILNLEVISFEGDVYDGLPPMRYPNPLATIFYEHNLRVAEYNNIEVGYYTERSFSENAIPKGGISLNDWFMLYADYRDIVFSQSESMTASISIPFLSIARNFNESKVSDTVRQKLREIRAQQGDIKITVPDGTILMGFNALIHQQLDGSDDIEGESCFVWEVSTVQDEGSVTRLIMMKRNRLKYPYQLLHHLASEFTYIVEPIPLPLLDSRGTIHNTIYLARAVAYVPTHLALLNNK